MTFDERERRKEKVRQELAKAGRKKKGFMTPERKKKLRVNLSGLLTFPTYSNFQLFYSGFVDKPFETSTKRGTTRKRKTTKENCGRTSWRTERLYENVRW